MLDNLEYENAALEAYQYLQDEYGTFSQSDRLTFENKLTTMFMHEGDDLKKFIGDFEHIFAKLRALQTSNYTLTEGWVLDQLFKALPDSYIPFIRENSEKNLIRRYQKITYSSRGDY